MNFDFLLPSTLLRKGREYSRKLWVRVLIMGLLAVLSLLLSMLIERWIPQSLATYLTGSAADRLLSIIANAMPVLPEVGSTSFWSGCTVRRSSPSATRLAATRSLTAPNGLYHSSLA